MALASLCDLERFSTLTPPFGRILGITPLYIVAPLNHNFFSLSQGRRISSHSLTITPHYSFQYQGWRFPLLLYLHFFCYSLRDLSCRTEAVHSVLSSFQEDLLYKLLQIWCVYEGCEFRVFLPYHLTSVIFPVGTFILQLQSK